MAGIWNIKAAELLSFHRINRNTLIMTGTAWKQVYHAPQGILWLPNPRRKKKSGSAVSLEVKKKKTLKRHRAALEITRISVALPHEFPATPRMT